jgi:hypothetical protein
VIAEGIADKLGNRYEAKWLVRKAVEVLAGKADWLVFEVVASAFQCFEFAVGRKEITEWHQTKINSSQGNWTINALNKEGILQFKAVHSPAFAGGDRSLSRHVHAFRHEQRDNPTDSGRPDF